APLLIPTLPRLPPAKRETHEPAHLDLLAAMQRIDDRLEHCVDDDLGVLLREVRDAGDFLDEFSFCHRFSGGLRPRRAPLTRPTSRRPLRHPVPRTGVGAS